MLTNVNGSKNILRWLQSAFTLHAVDVSKLVAQYDFAKLTIAAQREPRYDGLTPEQRATIERITARAQKRHGQHTEATPWRRFSVQRNRAKQRGIAWRLSFAQWWTLWQEHWHLRGCGRRNYCMQRPGDKGAYEIGNVVIGPVTENVTIAWRQRKNFRNGR